MRTAIVTDTNSGLSVQQGKEMGVFVLPMPVVIGGKDYFEGLNLTQDEFYRELDAGADITTSQPTPESVMNLWDTVLKDYDELVHIPMSSALTGAVQTAKMLAQDYEGRVFVADNHRISVTQRQAVLDALELVKRGYPAEKICRVLEETGKESTIYIMLDTLHYLRKGGRITPAAAALGTIFHIKPVLTIQGGKLDAFAKARTVKQGKALMLTAIQHDLKTRWDDTDGSKMHLAMAHTRNFEAVRAFRQEFQELFPGQEIFVDQLPLSIAVHIGPGSLALAASRRLALD